MKYFQPEFLDFFKILAANNNKIWFDQNRKDYEKFVKKPFAIFIDDLIREMQNLSIPITPESKNAIFRINRDIRFSKDKTPYKLGTSALLSPSGRKDLSIPGFYMELNPEKMSIYGGMYMPSTAQIQKIRSYITSNLKDFSEIIMEPEFVAKYDSIQGEQNSRIPKEFKESVLIQPLISNKQWYIQSNLEPETILQENLMSIVIDSFKVAIPFHNFIEKALE